METLAGKLCTSCGELKPTSEYYRNPSNRDRLDKMCKECKKAATRRWKAENRDHARATDRRWREQNRELCRRWNAANRDRCKENLVRWKEANPARLAEWHRQRRARLSAGPRYSEAEWHALLATFGYRCVACGVEARNTPEGFLTPDHVIPVCMAGPNTIDNIQPLCLDCNRRKNGRVIDYRQVWTR